MIRLVLVTLFFAALLSCAPPQERPSESAESYIVDPEARPNVIVIVVDDLRWDELGVAGHPLSTLWRRMASISPTPSIRFRSALRTVPPSSPDSIPPVMGSSTMWRETA